MPKSDLIDHIDTLANDHAADFKRDPDLAQALAQFEAQAAIVDLLVRRELLVDQLAGDLPAIEHHLGRRRPTGSYEADAGTVVYVAHDRYGKPLYIGVTDDLFARMASHRRAAPWWNQMAKVTWEHWHDRCLALAKELKLIRRHRPPFNTIGNPAAKETR